MAYKFNINPNNPNKIEKLNQAQARTIDDLIKFIDIHQIALMVRPTGFGKTYLMIEFAKQQKYSKVLYVYPSDVIKNTIKADYHDSVLKYTETEKEHLENPELPYIEFCSYAKMYEDWKNTFRVDGDKPWSKYTDVEKRERQAVWESLSDEEKLKRKKKWLMDRFSDIELLILDEAHVTGADGFSEYWEYIHKLSNVREKSKRLHILGATATPNRTDNKVKIHDIFYYTYNGGNKPAKIDDFTLDDCWKTGILERPYYVKGLINRVDEEASIIANLSKLSNAGDKPVKNEFDTADDVEDKLEKLLRGIEPIEKSLRDALKHIDLKAYTDGRYIRFLVFYANSADMIKYHSDIEDIFKFGVIDSDDNPYNTLNNYFITSEIENLGKSGIKIDNVGIINQRDIQVNCSDESDSNFCDFGNNQIDLIHSIDKLNMGYHVGNVTGVVIKRATGSEIMFYQQIGRCMSVKAKQSPIVLDLANAEAELFNRAQSDERDAALKNIADFVEGSIQAPCNDAVIRLYKFLDMYINESQLPDEMIDFWYLNRKSPIYVLRAAAISVGYTGTLSETIEKLIAYLKKVKRLNEFVDDSEYKKEPRLNKKMHKLIDSEIAIIKKLKNSGVK